MTVCSTFWMALCRLLGSHRALRKEPNESPSLPARARRECDTLRQLLSGGGVDCRMCRPFLLEAKMGEHQFGGWLIATLTVTAWGYPLSCSAVAWALAETGWLVASIGVLVGDLLLPVVAKSEVKVTIAVPQAATSNVLHDPRRRGWMTDP